MTLVPGLGSVKLGYFNIASNSARPDFPLTQNGNQVH